MPVVIGDYTWYRRIGFRGNTLLGWSKEGIVFDVEYGDYRRLELFAGARAEPIGTKTNHVFGISSITGELIK